MKMPSYLYGDGRWVRSGDVGLYVFNYAGVNTQLERSFIRWRRAI